MSPRPIQPFQFLFNTEGMNQHLGPFNQPPDSATHILNMHMTDLGAFTAYQQGYSQLGTPFPQAIDALGTFIDPNGNRSLLLASGTSISAHHPVTGALVQTLHSLHVPGQPVDFEKFKGLLFMAETGLPAQKWTGSGASVNAGGFPIGTDNLQHPSLVEIHNNRLAWGRFEGFPSHIAISDTLAPETFTLGTQDNHGIILQVNPGDGQKLVAMKSLNVPATNDTLLILWKEKSLYALEGNSPDTFNLIKLNDQVGALNNRCVVPLGSEVLFLDETNIYNLSTVNQSGSIQPKIIGSEKIKKELARINLSAKDKAWALHIPFRSEVWFGLPTGASPTVNTILVYRYPTAPGETHTWTKRSALNTTCATVLDNRLLSGDQSGSLQEWFGKSQYHTTPFPWEYRYPYLHFNQQTTNKRILELYLWCYLPGPTTLSIRTEWRGGGSGSQLKIEERTISPAQGGSIYGDSGSTVGVYGTSYFAEMPLTKIKVFVPGNGEQFRLQLSGTTTTLPPVFLGCSGLVEFSSPSRKYK